MQPLTYTPRSFFSDEPVLTTAPPVFAGPTVLSSCEALHGEDRLVRGHPSRCSTRGRIILANESRWYSPER